ncbi:epoxide hydrolase 4-like isoform X2 [Mangifera indica]|uniref:epoxide hydrolase 4-like isoform X2 n=1 Tax=Mangifera indica TaxID=29780 RepID=UPI001CFC3194|nr:epoxide hydrolase 4-like isoform X2 [Mangifera indica]
MVNFFSIYKPLLHGALKLVGMTTQAVEIEPGTVLNFWLPTETTKKMKNKTSKPAVVFLHGFAMDGILNWQFQVLALANKYAVYVPDFLFFGGSITDRPERTVEFQSECMAKGLRKLGVEKCTVVGLSYGGMVGFKMAEMYPELVESMVVSCSVMALTESVSNTGLQRIGFSSWAEFLLPKTVEGVRTLFDIGSCNLPKVPKFICEDILEAMFDHRKERSELLEALVISDEKFSIPHYPQKIYLLWGENDVIFDMETARNLKEQGGEKATLMAIQKAGHLVNLERPFVYNKHLKTILASLTLDKCHNN